MKIVIIEDEKITADDLAFTIKELEPNAEIVAVLHSVKSGINYFQNNPTPDLIFSDVQLGDGLSFEIFNAIKITSPIIFCTAYDEYALHAFKTNGIDYILKPSTEKVIADALNKYHDLQETFKTKEIPYKEIIDAMINSNQTNSASILVHYKDKITPIRMDDVAMFYIDTEITYLITLDKTKYSINKTMDELEKQAGLTFFRANRQCLINRKAVVDISHYFSGKLSVNLLVPYHDKITISKAKKPIFLNWLENTL